MIRCHFHIPVFHFFSFLMRPFILPSFHSYNRLSYLVIIIKSVDLSMTHAPYPSSSSSCTRAHTHTHTHFSKGPTNAHLLIPLYSVLSLPSSSVPFSCLSSVLFLISSHLYPLSSHLSSPPSSLPFPLLCPLYPLPFPLSFLFAP